MLDYVWLVAPGGEPGLVALTVILAVRAYHFALWVELLAGILAICKSTRCTILTHFHAYIFGALVKVLLLAVSGRSKPTYTIIFVIG